MLRRISARLERDRLKATVLEGLAYFLFVLAGNGIVRSCNAPPEPDVNIQRAFTVVREAKADIKVSFTDLVEDWDASSISLYFYEDNYAARTQELEILGPGSPEEPGISDPLPLSVDPSFYRPQLDNHDNGEGYFTLADDLREGLVKSYASQVGLSYFASYPVSDDKGRIVGYIGINFAEAPPLPSEAILDRLSALANNVSNELFPRYR